MAAVPAEPTMLAAPASPAGSLGSLHAAICPHAGFLLVLLLLAVWILAANSFARGPPPEAREHSQEWVVGARVDGRVAARAPRHLRLARSGRLLRRPWGTRMVTLPRCVGHLPHATALPSRPTVSAGSHACGSGRRNRLLAPASPPSSRGGQCSLPPPPCPCLGYLREPVFVHQRKNFPL